MWAKSYSFIAEEGSALQGRFTGRGLRRRVVEDSGAK